jgi:hypothetical protein
MKNTNDDIRQLQSTLRIHKEFTEQTLINNGSTFNIAPRVKTPPYIEREPNLVEKLQVITDWFN